MRIVYNKKTYEIVLIEEDDSSFITTPDSNDIFYGSLEEFINLQEVDEDRYFGEMIKRTFLAQNRALYLQPAANVALLQAFSEIERLLGLGDIKTSYYLVSQLTTDLIFTQARKDKFLGLLGARIQKLL
jgi:hypothetical protein